MSALATDLRTAWQKHPQNTNKRRAASAEEYVFLDLLRTCDLLSRGFAEVLETEGLSATRYNVLRILVDAAAQKPVWETVYGKTFRDPDKALQNMDKEVNELVTKSFRDFPPKAKN